MSARRLLGRHTSMAIGGGLLLAIVAVVFLGPFVWTVDPFHQDLGQRLRPAVFLENGSWDHPLGTDHLGRDVLARLMQGGQVSIFIGLFATLVSGVIGTTLGVLAGYYRGRVDAVVSYVITVRLSIPTILFALSVVALVGGSLLVVCLTLGVLIWDRFAVVSRTAAIQICSKEYVKAARAIGASSWQTIWSEVLPNMWGPLIVVGTVEMAQAILLESALSFLGIGVQPPSSSWGLMISEAKALLFFQPWNVMIPGIALLVLVLAINFLGDGLRDLAAVDEA